MCATLPICRDAALSVKIVRLFKKPGTDERHITISLLCKKLVDLFGSKKDNVYLCTHDYESSLASVTTRASRVLIPRLVVVREGRVRIPFLGV